MLAAGTGRIYSGSFQNSACSKIQGLGEMFTAKCQAMQRIYAKKAFFFLMELLKLKWYFKHSHLHFCVLSWINTPNINIKSPIFNPTIAIITQDILSSAPNWDNLPPHAKLATVCGSCVASWLSLRRQMLTKRRYSFLLQETDKGKKTDSCFKVTSLMTMFIQNILRCLFYCSDVCRGQGAPPMENWSG